MIDGLIVTVCNICILCGAKVHSPCMTATEQFSCELPDFCFDKERVMKSEDTIIEGSVGISGGETGG